jgi:heme/copper-type cytochrome/quinol oxidase subunit 2
VSDHLLRFLLAAGGTAVVVAWVLFSPLVRYRRKAQRERRGP